MLSKKNKTKLKDLIATFGMASQEFASADTHDDILEDDETEDTTEARKIMDDAYNALMFFINNEI